MPCDLLQPLEPGETATVLLLTRSQLFDGEVWAEDVSVTATVGGNTVSHTVQMECLVMELLDDVLPLEVEVDVLPGDGLLSG